MHIYACGMRMSSGPQCLGSRINNLPVLLIVVILRGASILRCGSLLFFIKSLYTAGRSVGFCLQILADYSPHSRNFRYPFKSWSFAIK